jgi:hypothetical protein
LEAVWCNTLQSSGLFLETAITEFPANLRLIRTKGFADKAPIRMNACRTETKAMGRLSPAFSEKWVVGGRIKLAYGLKNVRPDSIRKFGLSVSIALASMPQQVSKRAAIACPFFRDCSRVDG